MRGQLAQQLQLYLPCVCVCECVYVWEGSSRNSCNCLFSYYRRALFFSHVAHLYATCMHTHVQTRTHTHTHTHTLDYTHARLVISQIYMPHTHTHARTHTYTHAHTIHTYMHTNTQKEKEHARTIASERATAKEMKKREREKKNHLSNACIRTVTQPDKIKLKSRLLFFLRARTHSLFAPCRPGAHKLCTCALCHSLCVPGGRPPHSHSPPSV